MLHISIRRWMAVLGVALLLTGCAQLTGRRAGPVPVRPGAEPAKTDLITIRMAVTPGSDAAKLDALITAFQDQHPRYRVEKVLLPDPTFEDLTTEQKVLVGEVDLFSVKGMLGVWSNEGKNPAADLMPFAQKSGFDLTPYSPVHTELSYRGRLQELPWAVRPTVLVANKPLMAKAGVTLPEGGWTWDEFVTAARKVSRRDGARKVWGIAGGLPMVDLVMVQVAQAGQIGRKDEDAVRDALRLIDDLVRDETIMAVPKPGSDTKTVSVANPFLSGDAGISLMPLESVSGLQVPFDVQILPMPTLPGSGVFTPVHLSSYAIADQSPNQEAAWELLSFLAGPDGARLVARIGYLPYRLSAEAKQAYLEAHPQLPAEVAGALDTAWVTYPYYLQGQSRPAVLWKAAMSVLRGEDWEAAAREYQSGVAGLKGSN